MASQNFNREELGKLLHEAVVAQEAVWQKLSDMEKSLGFDADGIDAWICDVACFCDVGNMDPFELADAFIEALTKNEEQKTTCLFTK